MRPPFLALLSPVPQPRPPPLLLLLTQQEQAVGRFISQPLFLQLLLYFFVGFSLRFLIDTLILRFAVAQTPHSRCLGWMSNRCLCRFSIYKEEEVEWGKGGGRGRGRGPGKGVGGEGRERQKTSLLYPCVPAAVSLLFFFPPPPRGSLT